MPMLLTHDEEDVFETEDYPYPPYPYEGTSIVLEMVKARHDRLGDTAVGRHDAILELEALACMSASLLAVLEDKVQRQFYDMVSKEVVRHREWYTRVERAAYEIRPFASTDLLGE
jgi:hypothetical protein